MSDDHPSKVTASIADDLKSLSENLSRRITNGEIIDSNEVSKVADRLADYSKTLGEASQEICPAHRLER